MKNMHRLGILMEDPSYTNRANEVRRKFGDDYSIPYAEKNQSSIKHVKHHTEASILIHRNGQQINNTEY